MRKRIFLTQFMFLQISLLVIGQTIDPDCEWRVNYSRMDIGAKSYLFQDYYRDFIDGDTIINDIEYNKIYHSGYTYEEWYGNGWYTYYDHTFHGYLREEDGKWYTYRQNQDRLLFDFTLDIGDTIISANIFHPDLSIVIENVDSILVEGEYKRRLHLFYQGGYSVADFIIEDIGSTTGLFEHLDLFEEYAELICFAKNGSSLWGDSTEECDLAVDIDDHEDNSVQIALSPNPAHDFTMLHCPVELGKVTFKLVNLFGVSVYQETIENQSPMRIQLPSIPPGIYIAVICNQEICQSRKLIIK